ncbi:hypothetical protein GCM10027275_51210 [Rhabdobacter roseus]|uniref:Uncharacterized protein n=1 Tax=Rhabdobacter roseus TaxID=1655419 RepID=A0A840TW88_9BACT|nr:hypothetical protein [Rhabdobacter roseus]MBB5287195.1 hypothetical protein [Rhabdobacter roseus]
MKRKWNDWFQKALPSLPEPRESTPFDLLTDQDALLIRGGDKDYAPTYEHESEDRLTLVEPAMLIRM